MDPDTGDSDVAGACLRRTQSNIKWRSSGAQRHLATARPRCSAAEWLCVVAADARSRACGCRVRLPILAGGSDSVRVEGLFDPVSLLPKSETGGEPGSGSGTTPDRAVAERALMTPNVYSSGGEGLAQFKKGFLKFKQEVITAHQDHFRTLATAQHPKVMVIACCDSRVDPALLMGAGPGDIFTVR